MTRKRNTSLFWLTVFAWGIWNPLASLADDSAGSSGTADRRMLRDAQQIIADYHAGQPRSESKLRVVYFVPSDREPLPDNVARLNRAIDDVNDFYCDQLRRLGLETDGLPLEKKEGKLVLHLVRGKLPASEYRHESGDRTAFEIRAALKDTVDLDREHVLVLYGLCHQEPDGRYVFNAPYYGRGAQSYGLCHAADCEMLDPRLLTETKKQIVYTEHYYPRVQESVAKFNTKYLGGIAHELGHAFGLPHDAGGHLDRDSGRSLMGGGNLTYRQERWGRGAPVFLATASALQLASHPLITHSDRGRFDSVKQEIQDLKFTTVGNTLQLQGTAKSSVPAYAMVAYVWPQSARTDHGAKSFPVLMKSDSFKLELKGLQPNTYHLKLVTLHVNGGATVSQQLSVGFDEKGKPNALELNANWIVDRAEQAVMNRDPRAGELVSAAAIAAVATPEAQRQLRLLQSVLNPPEPVELGQVRGDKIFLSDVSWTDAKVGWGSVARNHYWFDDQIQNGVLFKLGGQFFEKGIYAHSPARYTFAVDNKWNTLTATVGLQDGAQRQGSAIFMVQGDGRPLYRSKVLRAGDLETVNIDITEVKELELLTEGGEGHPHNSWAIWAEPELQRQSQ